MVHIVCVYAKYFCQRLAPYVMMRKNACFFDSLFQFSIVESVIEPFEKIRYFRSKYSTTTSLKQCVFLRLFCTLGKKFVGSLTASVISRTQSIGCMWSGACMVVRWWLCLGHIPLYNF